MLSELVKRETKWPWAKIFLSSILVIGILNFIVKAPYMIKNSAYEVFRHVHSRYVIHQMAEKHVYNDNEHVIVFYQDDDGEVIDAVLDVVDEFLPQVNEQFNFQPCKKVPIVIHPDKQSLNSNFGWDADESAMGVYWAGVIRLLSPKAWMEDMEIAAIKENYRHNGPVVHEYVHYVVDIKTRGNYTRWFTEALAQYWEREFTGFQFNLKEGDLSQGLYPLAAMNSQFDKLPNQALAYSQSLAAADFIYQHFDHYEVEQLLLALGRGYTLSQAMEQVFGYDLIQFEDRFIKWVKENYQQESGINQQKNAG